MTTTLTGDGNAAVFVLVELGIGAADAVDVFAGGGIGALVYRVTHAVVVIVENVVILDIDLGIAAFLDLEIVLENKLIALGLLRLRLLGLPIPCLHRKAQPRTPPGRMTSFHPPETSHEYLLLMANLKNLHHQARAYSRLR